MKYVQNVISNSKKRHKQIKNDATDKNDIFRKMDLKFQNPKFIILHIIAYILI